MSRKVRVLSMLTAFVLLGISLDARTPATAPTQSAITPSQSGLILHIDPVTGAIVDQPASGATRLDVSATLAERWITSDEGLVEQPNPSGGKGVYVNLQGRFENGMVVTVDASGALNAPCAQGLNTAGNVAATQK